MKKTPSSSCDPQILAVLHRVGRTWRALVATNKHGQPEALAAREFPPDRATRLDEWLDEHNVGSALCVLPSGAVICRTFALPDAPADQLQQALQLQAEAHLLGIAPPHRLSMCVLPEAAGETSRTGLVLAWPEAAMIAVPPTKRRLEFVPDVAAIAALLNGHRPNEAVMWLDREDGSVAMAIAHSGGVIFRATREDASSTEDWQRSIARIAAETALNVGHTGAFVEGVSHMAQANAAALRPNEARLFLPEEIIAAVASRGKGLGTDSAWWQSNGITAGAMLARLEGGPLNPLTHMLEAPPEETPSPVVAVAQKLSRPQTAAVVVLACVLIAMFSPLVFAAARLGILKMRFGNVQTQLAEAMTVKHQISMYSELERQNAWSMIKLLSDIAVYTPIGIEIESIRVEGAKDVTIGGTAISADGKSPAQVVTLMQDNMRSNGMFIDIAVTAGKADNLGRYKFDISAKVARPYAHPPLPEELDFAKTPYAVRLYGEDARPGGLRVASSTVTPPGGQDEQQQQTARQSPPDDTASDRAQRIATASDGSQSPWGRSDDADRSSSRSVIAAQSSEGAGVNPLEDRGGMAVNPRAVPPPLSREQIEVMSVAELKDALSKVGQARQNKDLDQETRDRLRAEWDLIMQQLRKATAT